MNINRLIDSIEICPKSLKRLDKFYNTYNFNDVSTLLEKFFSFRKSVLLGQLDSSNKKRTWSKMCFPKREEAPNKSLVEIVGPLDDDVFFVTFLTHHLYYLIRYCSTDRSIIHDKKTFENIKDDVHTLVVRNTKMRVEDLKELYSELIKTLKYPEEISPYDWFINRNSIDILTNTKLIVLKRVKLFHQLRKECGD